MMLSQKEDTLEKGNEMKENMNYETKESLDYDLIVSIAEPVRIDKYVSEKYPDLSRQFVVELISNAYILINQKPIKKNYILRDGDAISIHIPVPTTLNVQPEDISLDILYEDQDLIVVNKGKNMAVHPAPGNEQHTLVNALLYHCDDLSGINGKLRPGIVHRIDKDTTGILVVAKNDEAHRNLAEQFKNHTVDRHYTALVFGQLEEKAGRIEAPIGRDTRDRKRMAVNHKTGKAAITHYRVLARFPGYSLLDLRLETGRTHQIRVHLSYIKHPLVGDSRYTNRKNPFLLTNEQMLHAGSLGFVHPRTQEHMMFVAPLPDYFRDILSRWHYDESKEFGDEGLSD